MKFNKLLKELNSTIISEEIFVKFLYAIIIYLSLLLILTLTPISRTFAFLTSLIYFIVVMVLEWKKDKIEEVEQSYPNLKEEITTARDNIKVNNPIVDALKKEIKEKVKYVRSSTFFPLKRVYVSFAIIVLLSFGIVFITSNSITAKKFITNDLPGLLSFGGKTPLNGTFNDSYATNITDDIYGEADILQLGNKQLDIRLMPSSYEISVREEGEFKGKTFDNTYASNIQTESSDAFEENIPKEQQDLVKNYFLKLAEG